MLGKLLEGFRESLSKFLMTDKKQEVKCLRFVLGV